MTLLENLQNDIRQYISGDSATAPLLKRVLLFLEDGEFIQADAYCEKVLDIDPENSLAYMCKLMASRRMQSIQELIDAKYTVDGDSSYKKCVRFASEAMKQHLHTMNMQIYTNCIAASRDRARIHMSHGELMETAQQYHTAMKLWEDSKETLPNSEAIYEDLANEVSDFNWKLLLHDRQCPDDAQLIARAIPIDNDRWYESACKWGDEAKLTYYRSVAKQTLFNTHLKCTEAISGGHTKLAEIWAGHYQAAAAADDPLPGIHEALVATDGYTRFAPDAVKAMLQLIGIYKNAYPQGVDQMKAHLQDYYQNIFQTLLDFAEPVKAADISTPAEDYVHQITRHEAESSGSTETVPAEESAAEVVAHTDPAAAMQSAREVTAQMAAAVTDGLSPYGAVSTYLVAAKALTIRYGTMDGTVTDPNLFRFICGYYKDALAHAQAEQADAIREKFNNFLIETVRLPSSNIEVAVEASACMNDSSLPYQLYLSLITNDYSVNKEQLIPQQLTDELARWHQLIENTHPRKGHYWLSDQQENILATFDAAEKAAETCRQYPATLQAEKEEAYKNVLEQAGDCHREELSSGWTQKMDALQGHCNEWADTLAQALAQAREVNSAKLEIAKKRIKQTEGLQLTRSILSVLLVLLTCCAFISASISAVNFAQECTTTPEAGEGFTKLFFYCVNIGLPVLAGAFCLINGWAIRHYGNKRFRRTIWLFAICSALSYLAMYATSKQLLLDTQLTFITQHITEIAITGGLLILCAVARTLLESSFSKLSARTRSKAAKITCKVGTVTAFILLMLQALLCVCTAGLFVFALITC